MNSLVVFTFFWGLPENKIRALQSALERAISQFNHLERGSFQVGQTHPHVWGHKSMEKLIHHMPDGLLLELIGSPSGYRYHPTFGKKALCPCSIIGTGFQTG
jgi:hypothetical protein